MSEEIKKSLVELAETIGFDVIRVTSADAIPDAGKYLREYIDHGYHGDMEWMETTADRRSSPVNLWPDVRSIILLGMNYGPGYNPLDDLKQVENGTISVYARGKDYHDIIKKKLKQVAGELHRLTGNEVKVFVDTAPVMEKPLAEAAGLGWQGKHSNLVSRKFGSWLFLGSIFTTAVLPVDKKEEDHCGSCSECLNICPTDAFPAPYKLDATKCIAYLTIEYKGQIDHEFRDAIGNRVYGCDDCLAVCPWNKFARASAEMRFLARPETSSPPLGDLLELDDASFRKRFAGTPVKRTGRDRFIRNVLIAAGNSGNTAYLPKIQALLKDPSALVRGMAVWACHKLMTEETFTGLRHKIAHYEKDDLVRAEWEVLR